ncbi:MAG: hypothetical protein DWQ09_14845 [Proteobacteria bacterium]|nr:MAG: hypothetical protein DWQ09_14845 [Pseudomonadota bacterium]QKK11651.1 MAG: hypothetical protein HND59_08680 [Pseudomonadota bacterium]
MKPLSKHWPLYLLLATLPGGTTSYAQFPQPGIGHQSYGGPRETITISGRVVTDDGTPVSGIELGVPISGGLLGLPVRRPFRGMSSMCFDNFRGSFTTDEMGRYSFTVDYLPEAPSGLGGDERCHQQRSRMTQNNINVIPSPFGPINSNYTLRVATGPLPTRPLPTPTLLQNPNPARRTPGGFAPSLSR